MAYASEGGGGVSECEQGGSKKANEPQQQTKPVNTHPYVYQKLPVAHHHSIFNFNIRLCARGARQM